jgi:hypothetical protein
MHQKRKGMVEHDGDDDDGDEKEEPLRHTFAARLVEQRRRRQQQPTNGMQCRRNGTTIVKREGTRRHDVIVTRHSVAVGSDKVSEGELE